MAIAAIGAAREKYKNVRGTTDNTATMVERVWSGEEKKPLEILLCRVVRIAVLVFDELLCVVARSSVGHKDGWGQVDARVPVELSLLFSFGHEAWAGAGC